MEKDNLDSSEFTHYDRSSGSRSRKRKVYTDIELAVNTKINHIRVFFTDHCNVISIDRN